MPFNKISECLLRNEFFTINFKTLFQTELVEYKIMQITITLVQNVTRRSPYFAAFQGSVLQVQGQRTGSCLLL